MENIKKILSDNLKASRKSLGMTQETLAEKAGVSLFTVQAYEAGRRWPELETLDKIASSLMIETSDLFQKPRHESAEEEALALVASKFGYHIIKK